MFLKCIPDDHIQRFEHGLEYFIQGPPIEFRSNVLDFLEPPLDDLNSSDDNLWELVKTRLQEARKSTLPRT